MKRHTRREVVGESEAATGEDDTGPKKDSRCSNLASKLTQAAIFKCNMFVLKVGAKLGFEIRVESFDQ